MVVTHMDVENDEREYTVDAKSRGLLVRAASAFSERGPTSAKTARAKSPRLVEDMTSIKSLTV